MQYIFTPLVGDTDRHPLYNIKGLAWSISLLITFNCLMVSSLTSAIVKKDDFVVYLVSFICLFGNFILLAFDVDFKNLGIDNKPKS